MQTSESFRLSAVLSFSGGLQDAYTYSPSEPGQAAFYRVCSMLKPFGSPCSCLRLSPS